VRLADELHDAATVSNELWTERDRLFAPHPIVELLVLVGFYHTISFVTNELSIELEERGERFSTTEFAA